MEIGQFAALKVARTRKDAALLDWGKQELLPLPLEEQRFEVRKGDTVVVYITTDERVFERPMATMKWEEHLQHDPEALATNQKVGGSNPSGHATEKARCDGLFSFTRSIFDRSNPDHLILHGFY